MAEAVVLLIRYEALLCSSGASFSLCSSVLSADVDLLEVKVMRENGARFKKSAIVKIWSRSRICSV